MIKKLFINFVLLSLLLCLSGCEVRPNEIVKSFLDSIKEKKIEQAGKYCTTDLRESLRNFPSAFSSYKYGIKKFDFKFTDLQKTKDGLVAIVQVKVNRSEPPPQKQNGLMSIYLKKFDDKWYINSINIDTVNIEYKKKPVDGIKPQVFNARPFWVAIQEFSGPVSNFVFKYDNYCKEWEQ